MSLCHFVTICHVTMTMTMTMTLWLWLWLWVIVIVALVTSHYALVTSHSHSHMSYVICHCHSHSHSRRSHSHIVIVVNRINSNQSIVKYSSIKSGSRFRRREAHCQVKFSTTFHFGMFWWRSDVNNSNYNR